MANEISMTVSIQVVKGNFEDAKNSGSIQIDQAAIGRAGHAQEIGTAAEVVDLGDVVDNGVAYLKNLDADNFIEYGPESDAATIEVFGRLNPGEVAAFRLSPAIILWAQADTAAVLLDVTVYEN